MEILLLFIPKKTELVDWQLTPLGFCRGGCVHLHK